MKRTTLVTLTTLLVILLIAALVVYLVLEHNSQRELQQSEAASAFVHSTSSANYTDFAGNDANLDQFLGQILIVTSWASWAPSSANELKLLTSVAKEYNDQNVVVIGINRAEPQTTAESYLRTLGLSQEVLLIVDPNDRYYKAVGGYTMPETVVYDTKGNVVHHKHGSITATELTDILDSMLANSGQ